MGCGCDPKVCKNGYATIGSNAALGSNAEIERVQPVQPSSVAAASSLPTGGEGSVCEDIIAFVDRVVGASSQPELQQLPLTLGQRNQLSSLDRYPALDCRTPPKPMRKRLLVRATAETANGVDWTQLATSGAHLVIPTCLIQCCTIWILLITKCRARM